jgi:ribonucleoside-diphosphate reductase alpha chain|tara:strand:- start:1165 stop:3090 length:1926 start_codon:yes stop_codon:yes gene_type:complete
MNKLPTQYQEFIHLSRYARWNEDLGRRENWQETVNRYFDFFETHLKDNNNFKLTKKLRTELEQAVLNLEIMPSMRALMSAGPALERDNVAGFNCAYVAVDNPRVFDETLYILMCGTGVGFSVERQYINKLPDLPEELHDTDTIIKVADSKIGWSKAYKEFLFLLYSGQVPKWDLTNIRPHGARLKTFGGRASGPDPLDDLLRFTINIFKDAVAKGQKKLVSIDCHDLMCKIAEVVVVGGVRRSALISLSNLSDERMRGAKSGSWWEHSQHRALSNNSVAYTDSAEMGAFMKEWLSLYESKSGERGIFNRQAAEKQAAKNGRREEYKDFGCNPCSEIILRNKQFCNLTEVVIKPTDTYHNLQKKVKLATILGTFQASLVNFRYLSKAWQNNTIEEALLGVSFTGIMDNITMSGRGSAGLLEGQLKDLKDVAIVTNKTWAKKLKINQSSAITCVKPSGTVSQLVNSASGIHTRHSPYYIRTVRADKKDPLAQLMVDQGVYHEDDITKPEHTYVFYFPIKAPPKSVTRNELDALNHLKLWKFYQDEWCEHKPSCTISVREHEWLDVGSWVWKNFDNVSGISFLPHTDHSYKQAPYQEVTEDEYKEWLTKTTSSIDWSLITEYEKEDMTENTKELACTAGACEIL